MKKGPRETYNFPEQATLVNEGTMTLKSGSNALAQSVSEVFNSLGTYSQLCVLPTHCT